MVSPTLYSLTETYLFRFTLRRPGIPLDLATEHLGMHGFEQTLRGRRPYLPTLTIRFCFPQYLNLPLRRRW